MQAGPGGVAGVAPTDFQVIAATWTVATPSDAGTWAQGPNLPDKQGPFDGTRFDY